MQGKPHARAKQIQWNRQCGIQDYMCVFVRTLNNKGKVKKLKASEEDRRGRPTAVTMGRKAMVETDGR